MTIDIRVRLASSLAVSPTPAPDLAALRKEAAADIRHPLTVALLTLTFVTGIVDAISFLGLGRVFAANMTGNVVLLGFGVAGSGGLPVIAPLVSLGAFVAGAAAGGELARRIGARHPTHVARALLAEALLTAAAIVVVLVVDVRPRTVAAGVVIGLLAFAMGQRSAAVRHIGVPDLTTTVLTMTLTALAADPHSTAGRRRRIGAALTMFGGALAGALLLRLALVWPLAAAALLTLATAVAYPRVIRRG
jgi:uncharacterized membrane protein YoaK (UPF0700 family)